MKDLMGRMRLSITATLVMAVCLSAHAQDTTPPDQLVRETTRKVIAQLEAHQQEIKDNPGKVSGYVRDLVLPHFDFKAMSQLVLAQNWRKASAEQRQRFTDQFRQLLIRTYGSSLAQYTGQKVTFKPMQGEPSRGRVTVSTEVEPSDGPPVPIDYKLYQPNDAEWKVFDVIVDGVSLVQNYRSSFASEVRRNGLDSLIQRLSDRNASSGGAS